MTIAETVIVERYPDMIEAIGRFYKEKGHHRYSLESLSQFAEEVGLDMDKKETIVVHVGCLGDVIGGICTKCGEEAV